MTTFVGGHDLPVVWFPVLKRDEGIGVSCSLCDIVQYDPDGDVGVPVEFPNRL